MREVQIALPFKPFTIQEVCEITGVAPKTLDYWMEGYQGSNGILERKIGDDGFTTGLDYMQTFAVFVGMCYLHEGAPLLRANGVVRYVSTLNMEHLEKELRAGRNFPVVREMGVSHDMLIQPPEDNNLARILSLNYLLRHFQERIRRVFPNG